MRTLSGAGLHALYPALPAEESDRIAHAGVLLRLPAGSHVFAENQPCQGFPLLLSGTVKVIKTAPNGREMLLYRVEPGGSCIISSSCLLGKAPYSARGIAETPLVMSILPPDAFDRLIAGHPAFRRFVFHLFSERIGELMQLVEEVAFQRLDQRLAKLLLARTSAENARLHTTHQALADELGSVREIVSRLLKGFASQGAVALRREQIDIRDRAALHRLAGDEGATGG